MIKKKFNSICTLFSARETRRLISLGISYYTCIFDGDDVCYCCTSKHRVWGLCCHTCMLKRADRGRFFRPRSTRSPPPLCTEFRVPISPQANRPPACSLSFSLLHSVCGKYERARAGSIFSPCFAVRSTPKTPETNTPQQQQQPQIIYMRSDWCFVVRHPKPTNPNSPNRNTSKGRLLTAGRERAMFTLGFAPVYEMHQTHLLLVFLSYFVVHGDVLG